MTISYNPETKYEAKIHFLTLRDFQNELNLLFGDLRNEAGEIVLPRTSGVNAAWDKVRRAAYSVAALLTH